MGYIDEMRASLDADPRSDAEIARLAGINRVFLSRWKTGKQEMGSGKIESLARVLGLKITVADLAAVRVRKAGRPKRKAK